MGENFGWYPININSTIISTSFPSATDSSRSAISPKSTSSLKSTSSTFSIMHLGELKQAD